MVLISNEQIRLLVIIVGLTLLSGIGDSFGFVHAAKVWQEGQLVWAEVGKSALGFVFGISVSWLTIRYLQQFGIFAPETQTLLWFGVTIVGIALISGKFFHWQKLDQVVAVAVLIGIGWLMFSTGEG